MKNNIYIYLLFIFILTPKCSIARISKVDIESRLESLENKVNSNLNFELSSKLELLQKELQDLRGILEEQQHFIYTLKDQNSNNSNSKNAELNDHGNEGGIINIKGMLPDQNAYNAAYKFIENQKFKEALMAFKDFLLQYKDSKYAPNATYWIGELYLMDRKLDLAADYFLQVTEKFKNHDKSPDALLKLGTLEIDRGNYKAAKDYFLKIKENYNSSSRMHMADKRLKELERDGY